MALEGTIKEFGLADIFQLIGLQKKTGILFLKGTDETVNVHFEDGMVVKVEESQKRHKYLIGRIFINRGKVSETQVREALEIQKSTGQKLGGVLISQGFIKKDDLRDALSFQITEAVYKVFRWKGGDYKFDQERVDYDRDTIVPLSTEHILMDGIRMLDEWPKIEEILPDTHVVLRRMSSASEEAYEGGDIFAGTDEEREGGISKGSEHVLKLVDGKRSILEIIEMSMLGEFDTCKAVTDLLGRGMVSTTGEKPALITQKGPDIMPSAAAAGFAAAWLSYIFIAAALIIIVFQLTGTRKIMNPRATKFENLKKPFAMSEVKRVRNSMTGYFFDFGSYPDSIASLVQLDYIDANDITDPWGTPIQTVRDQSGNIIVISAGTDKTPATADDITSAYY